jgi:hypothetical protein
VFTGHHVPLVTRYITRRCADSFCSARDSLSVVQDSGFRVLSTVTDLLHCSLGHASFDRVFRMLHIVDFTTETCRDHEWDNIACVQRTQGPSRAPTRLRTANGPVTDTDFSDFSDFVVPVERRLAGRKRPAIPSQHLVYLERLKKLREAGGRGAGLAGRRQAPRHGLDETVAGEVTIAAIAVRPNVSTAA